MEKEMLFLKRCSAMKEMEAMCTEESFSTAACPMHGMNSYHAMGATLKSVLEAADVEVQRGNVTGYACCRCTGYY